MKFNGKQLKNHTKADLMNIIYILREFIPEESPIQERFE